MIFLLIYCRSRNRLLTRTGSSWGLSQSRSQVEKEEQRPIREENRHKVECLSGPMMSECSGKISATLIETNGEAQEKRQKCRTRSDIGSLMGPNIEVAFGGKREEARPRIDRPLRRSWSTTGKAREETKYSSGRWTMYVMHECIYRSMYCCVCSAWQED